MIPNSIRVIPKYYTPVPNGKKDKNKAEIYKCGDHSCAKFYHSYTAFYNHCKKSHGGEFPALSQHNDRLFEGPSKNRGRPRIKKNETKDQIQIESMKRENELIEFLGMKSINYRNIEDKKSRGVDSLRREPSIKS